VSGFEIKDSGARESFDSGMVRDTEEGKLDFSLVLDGPMFKRWAAHLTKGAQKYAPRNWMKAAGEAEFDRFKRSFLRHVVAYLDGDRDEDHAAAILFNVNGMEYVRDQLNADDNSYAFPNGDIIEFDPTRPCPDFTCSIPGRHSGEHFDARDGVTWPNHG
jgi:hypothetical protein